MQGEPLRWQQSRGLGVATAMVKAKAGPVSSPWAAGLAQRSLSAPGRPGSRSSCLRDPEVLGIFLSLCRATAAAPEPR